MRSFVLLPASLFFLAQYLCGQTAAGIVDPSRRIDWSNAGAGMIPNRTSVCTTLNPGATASQINAAIASCPSGQVVYLTAGTYNIGSPGIIFNDKDGVTLRGAGSDQTTLIFSAANSCGGLNGSICVINGGFNYYASPSNEANWTGGYNKGTTTITLSNAANMKVGTLLVLDQQNDPNTDNGEVWVCGNGGQGVCCLTCATGAGRVGPPRREQTQVVKVVAVNGNQVTIEDPLYMPNWRSVRTPGAWWSSDTAVTGVGIENLSLDHKNSRGSSGIVMFNAYGSWVKNIRSLQANRNHIWLYQSAHITVQSSYFYGTQSASALSYGVEHFTSSANLIENNIFHRIPAPMMTQNGCGSVFAYNYADDYWPDPPETAAAAAWHHGAGISYYLYEGNSWTIGLRADYFHGLSHFATAFRNRFQGWSSGKTSQTNPAYLQMGHRYYNFIGNVLGYEPYHTVYTCQAGTNCSGNRSIFSLGSGGFGLPDDGLVASTLMRWGNYDTVTKTIRWDAAEVPKALSKYANSVPVNSNLPASFYLSARPSWWGSQSGTPPWPAIGPDVVGGAGPGGHAHKIPAQLCYENSMRLADGTLKFNPVACYSQASATPPLAPTNLRTIVQ